MQNKKIINGVVIVEAPQGDIMFLDDKNINACVKVLETFKYKKMSIFEGLESEPCYNLDNLDLLNQFKYEIDEIIFTSQIIKDWIGLYSLKGLKKLRANWINDIVLDFSRIKNLRELWIDWSKRQTNLFNLPKLHELRLWKYKPKVDNLTELTNLKSLHALGIFQSNIKSIKGVEELNSLKTLIFGYNKNLEILFNDFKKPLNNIENLHIETCKIVNLDFIKLFPNLKKLEIVNHGKLKSLKPILDGLPKLEEIFIGETDIEESDNEYYKDYTNIKKFFFKEMRHHKLKVKDIGKWR